MLPKRPEVGHNHLFDKVTTFEKRQAFPKVASHDALSASTSEGGLTWVEAFISPMIKVKGYFLTFGPIFKTTLGVFT